MDNYFRKTEISEIDEQMRELNIFDIQIYTHIYWQMDVINILYIDTFNYKYIF